MDIYYHVCVIQFHSNDSSLKFVWSIQKKRTASDVVALARSIERTTAQWYQANFLFKYKKISGVTSESFLFQQLGSIHITESREVATTQPIFRSCFSWSALYEVYSISEQWSCYWSSCGLWGEHVLSITTSSHQPVLSNKQC